MKCFGKIWEFLMTTWIKNIKTCFSILLVFSPISKNVHFVKCIGMEMIH